MQHSEKNMDTIIAYAKRKGFVFPSSEIYDGLAGAYDFGPMGAPLLNNLKEHFRQKMIREKANMYEIDSAMFKNPRVWEASGHTKGFSDPLADCKNCQARIRVDKELEAIGVDADEKMTEEEINTLFDANRDKIKCGNCGKQDFGPARAFNLLVKSNLGDFTTEGGEPVYLPGEASQGIYLNFKNVVDSLHPKIPFGIAQIGKAFRNEISPRKFLFRTRELEQADTQFFVRPGENKDHYKRIKEERWDWYKGLGLSEENMRWNQHENLVFYTVEAWDIEYNFPSYGFDELEGIHDRTDYDLTVHSKASGVDLSYNDNGDKFIPYILETSVGLGRMLLAVLSEAYDEEELEGDPTTPEASKDSPATPKATQDKRVVLRLAPFLAPTTVAVLPLMKKDGLSEKAVELFTTLSKNFTCTYDETGSVGKRYRRQDEVGTPWCITVDYDSMENESVTVRERDSMEQERIKITELPNYFNERLKD